MSRIAASSLIALTLMLSANQLNGQEKSSVAPSHPLAQDKSTSQSVPDRAGFMLAQAVPETRHDPTKNKSCVAGNCQSCPECQESSFVDFAIATHTASAIGTTQWELTPANTQPTSCTDTSCRLCQASIGQPAAMANDTSVPIVAAGTPHREMAAQLVHFIRQHRNDEQAIQHAIEQSLTLAAKGQPASAAPVRMVLGASDPSKPVRPWYPNAEDHDRKMEWDQLREMVKQNQRQLSMLARRIDGLQPISNELATDLPASREYQARRLQARIAELEAQLENEKRLLPVPTDPSHSTLTPIEAQASPLVPYVDKRTGVFSQSPRGEATLVVTANHTTEDSEPTIMAAYDVTDLAQPPYFGSVVDLVQFIQSRVDRGEWDENSIQIFAGGNTRISLVISQEPSAHKKIRYLLDCLRMDAAELMQKQLSRR